MNEWGKLWDENEFRISGNSRYQCMRLVIKAFAFHWGKFISLCHLSSVNCFSIATSAYVEGKRKGKALYSYQKGIIFLRFYFILGVKNF